MSPALLALALVVAPAATPSPKGHVSWDSAAAAVSAAAARAGLDNKNSQETLAERAAAAKLSRAEIARVLDALHAACPTPACDDLHKVPGVVVMLDTLGEIGTVADAPLLLRLKTIDGWNPGRALDNILLRAMADAVPKARCAPPSAAEIAAVRADLADFAVLRERGGSLRGEALTDVERDDLAYFLAAVAEAGPAVGTTPEATSGSSFTTTAAADPERERLVESMKTAWTRGDLQTITRDGRAYLACLGYPGPIDGSAEDTWAWGGARYSYVFRELALASELQGDVTLAAQLYRRADPGGGMCGSSTDYRWAGQVRGLIRSAERAGDCRPVVAERLLDIDGPRDMWPVPAPNAMDYGPARLADAGFDLARLYRGALLTVGRDAEPDVVRAALERAPKSIRAAALARLARRGPEAWEARVHAIEGFADIARRAALPALLGMLRTFPAAGRNRAIAAVGYLAERPYSDPCNPEIGGLSLHGVGSGWERQISGLGDTCPTVLRLHEAAPLAMSLKTWLDDHDPETRRVAAEALGRIGHRAALPALRARKRDAYSPTDSQMCEADGCHRYFPVRDAVAAAITSITERSADDADWRRVDRGLAGTTD